MATEKQYPPNLNLKMNEQVRLKLLYDKCIEGTNSRGAYHLYRVLSDNGTEYSFSAPEEIHSQIVAYGLKAGSEFLLKKNGKGLTGELVFEALKPENGVAVHSPHPDNFREVMQQSLDDAVEISKTISGIDVQKIGTTIFIARTKANGFSS